MKVPVANRPTIDLYGLFGSFQIPQSSLIIRFFSTAAGPNSSTAGHVSLLEQLRPMRERLKASDLNDLSSLLQRDLNDRRVAQELVPYLLGRKNNTVGFFPAILAVLVPEGYLSSDESVEYPSFSIDKLNQNQKNYADFWQTEQYEDAMKQAVPLGMLKITLNKTQIIVLDGQHRANAFRYVAGVFNPQESIYQTFYQDTIDIPNKQLGTQLCAELPVTLIWFESTDDSNNNIIDPKLISRKLFVDVNNTAKPVSEARNILLDDRTVTAVATQSFYNESASRRFTPSRFSLMHGSFDMDGDLSRNKPIVSLTSPEIIESALSWALLSSTNFESLSVWNIARQYSHRNTTRLFEVFPGFEKKITKGGDDDLRGSVYLVDVNSAQEFREEFNANYGAVIYNLFDKLNFLAPHYRTCQEMSTWSEEVADTVSKEIWNKVFTGGEGLYWNFTTYEPENDRGREYLRGIQEIESRFSKIRAEQFGIEANKVNSAYNSFSTKAFLIGYVMAVSYLSRETGYSTIESSDLIVEGLNRFTYVQWLAIFNEFRPLLIAGVDPKKWPAYRNIIIRMHDVQDLFYNEDFLKNSPEWKAYDNKLNILITAFINTENFEEEDIKRACESEFNNLMEIINKCGLSSTWFVKGTVLPKGIDIVSKAVMEARNEIH